MTVAELRELLAEAPDDMPVMIMVPNHLKPGMLAFAYACPCDTGISTLGEGEGETEGGEEVFLVLPHGFGVVEGEEENTDIPELN